MAYTEVTEKTGIRELRKEARRLGLYTFLHNGLEVRVTDRECLAEHRKALYNAIVQHCSEINTKQSQIDTEPVTQPITEPVAEVVKEPTKQPVEQVDDKDLEIQQCVNKVYKKLEEIVFAELSNAANTFDLACTLPANIIDWIVNLADSENPDTVLVMRSKVLVAVEKKIAKITNHRDIWDTWFTRIRNSVYNSEKLANYAKSRAIRQRGSVQMRTASKMTVNVSKAYDWAFKVLDNVDKLKPSDWREVVAALIMVTGRRPSEITATAIFQKSEIEGCVKFYGQLKRHADIIVDGFDIPVIGGKSKEVIDALFWLDTNNKRAKPIGRTQEELQEAAKKAHKNYSKYIGLEFKKLYHLIEVVSGDWNFTNAKGQQEDRKEPSIFRKFYAQAFADTYHGIGDRDVIISEILGHSDNSTSFKPYDADYQLSSLDEIYTKHDKENFAKLTMNRVKARANSKYQESKNLLS